MDSILSVRDLTIWIEKRKLIQGVTFDVHSGDAVLLSGANGIGKSTLLKSILGLETEGKRITGEIVDNKYGNILDLKEGELQKYRSSVAYIAQKDDYTEMGNVQVRDIFSECSEPHLGKGLSCSEVNDLIDEWIPRIEGNRRVFDAKDRPRFFSGGEQRLLSVLSVVATRPNAEMYIVDEPLNNLDFTNARNISNIINKVIQNNPKMGLLMISHCRIFPFITREIKLTPEGVQEVSDRYVCHSCFGEHDEKGFY